MYARWVRDPADYTYLLQERLQNGMPSWFPSFLFRVLLFWDKGLRAVYWPLKEPFGVRCGACRGLGARPDDPNVTWLNKNSAMDRHSSYWLDNPC